MKQRLDATLQEDVSEETELSQELWDQRRKAQREDNEREHKELGLDTDAGGHESEFQGDDDGGWLSALGFIRCPSEVCD